MQVKDKTEVICFDNHEVIQREYFNSWNNALVFAENRSSLIYNKYVIAIDGKHVFDVFVNGKYLTAIEVFFADKQGKGFILL